MAYQPKSYRKFVATAATATLVASAVAPAALAASSFTDVAPKYKEAVDYLFDNGITNGKTEELFGTHDNIKRGELAIWLTRALGLEEEALAADPSGFADTAGTYYDGYVSVLKANEILSGKSADNFGVNDYLTRGEMAKLLSNAYGLVSEEEAPFEDMGQWAEYINGLYAYGITQGKTEDTFGTAEYIKRGDIAIFLFNAEGAVAPEPGDEIAPEFNYDGETELSIENGAKFVLPEVTATDDVDGELEVTPVITDAEGNEVALEDIDTTVAATYTVTYTAVDAAGNETELVLTVEVAEAVAPAVESVSAINPTNVEVTFTQAIDEETLNKSVSINNVAVDGAEFYKLSEDGKTLNVRVSKFEVDKAYAVKVEGLKTVDGEEVATFVEKVLFADATAASIESVTAKAGTSGKTKIVEVVFSEDVTGTEANFRVNNVSPSSVTIVNNVATLVLPADIESGKTHELRVAELQDLSGNKTSVTQEFTITADTTAPAASVEVKDENTIVVKFDEAVQAANSTHIKVLKGNVNVTGVIGALSEDGKSVEVQVNPLVFGSNESSANVTVEVAGVKDLYENAMAKATFSTTLVKDVVAPTVTGVEGIVGSTKFVVTFNEELAGTAGDLVTLPSLFKDNMKLDVDAAILKADKDGNLTQVEVTTAAALVAGTYEVTLAEGIVKDDTIAQNKNAQAKVSFATTTPTGESDTAKPEVSTVAVDGDEVTVTFNEDVSSSAASYLNYKIDGVTIPSQSVIYFDNSKKVVTIELPSGYFSADKADVIFEVTNVSDLAGNVMNKFTKLDLAVEDTKAPSLASAKLAANNEIVLEFNEAIDPTSTLVPGRLTIKDSTGATVLKDGASITTNATAAIDGKKVTITLAAGSTLDLTKSYTLTAEAGNGLVDQAGTNDDGTGNEAAPFSNVALVDGVAPILSDADVFADDTFSSNIVGITASSLKTSAIAKADLSEVPASAKVVYADTDANTADVVVTGTVELNAAQDQFTYSFGSANLSTLTAGEVTVSLVFVDANGNESVAHNVVEDGSQAQTTPFTKLTLVK